MEIEHDVQWLSQQMGDSKRLSDANAMALAKAYYRHMVRWRFIQVELPEIDVEVICRRFCNGGWSFPELGVWSGEYSDGGALVMNPGDDWFPATHWQPVPPAPVNTKE